MTYPIERKLPIAQELINRSKPIPSSLEVKSKERDVLAGFVGTRCYRKF